MENFEYDIFIKWSWKIANISYGFDTNVPLNTKNQFQTVASDITQNSTIILSELPENLHQDIHIGFADTYGYLALAYFPGEDSITSDILLSKELLAQQQEYQNFITWHKFGYSLKLAHKHDRTDSVMNVNFNFQVETEAQRFTEFDF